MAYASWDRQTCRALWQATPAAYSAATSAHCSLIYSKSRADCTLTLPIRSAVRCFTVKIRRALRSPRPKDIDNADNDYNPTIRLHACRLCRRPNHQSNTATTPYAADGGDECYFRHLPRRLFGAGGQRRWRSSHRSRHDSSRVCHGKYRRGLPHNRSNAVDVQTCQNRCNRQFIERRFERCEAMTEILIQLAYLFAAFLFITALRALGRPDSARRGMHLAAFGMAVAIIATLFQAGIVSYEWIVVGAAVGAVAGYPLGMWVPMTAMPQRIALSHAFGALAATLVGIGEYANGFLSGATLARTTVAALGLEVLFGGVT